MEHGLDTELIVAIAATLLVWTLFSARFERFDVSAPMAFVAAGLVLTNEPVSAINVEVHSETLRSLAEITLALLLFSDAARVNLRVLRHDAAVPPRLLLIGLPLSIGLGTAIAALCFPDLNGWAAATIAAAVAPTDAALGAQVVDDRNVPGRVRRIVNVESGLNDGIATPFVTFFLAGAVADTFARSSASLSGAVADLGIGVLVGVGVGLVGGFLAVTAERRGWVAPTYRSISALALALGSYALAVELGGNGFIAAFVGGLAFGTVLPDRDEAETLELDAQVGDLLSLVVWFLLGAILVPVLEDATWASVVFAVLALTVMRMVPVAISLLGARLRPMTVLFVGWFGPRGLASVVFGLIAFDALHQETADVVLPAIALTVLLSVLAHGITARPFARRYGEYIAALANGTNEQTSVPPVPTRPRPAAGPARRSAISELDE